MKTLNKVCQFLCILFGLTALALFFMNFATLTIDGKDYDFAGSILAFGSSKKLSGGVSVNMAKSADLLFCFLLTAFGFVMSIFSFKKKGFRYAVPAFSLGAAIYMLVVALSNPWKFVDARGDLSNKAAFEVTKVTYSSFVIFIAIALFVFAAFAIAYLLIDDKIESLESKGSKKTIFKRIGLFFRDYKSEAKKIVWPTFKDVLKNTLIVLIMCLIIGVLIWLLDWGLGNLIKVILGINS